MKIKNFIVASLIASFVDFMLGWLFYGVLFKNIYPPTANENLTFIYAGCLVYSLMIAYVFIKWAGIQSFKTGEVGGAILGLFYSLSMNFFMFSNKPFEANLFFADIFISVIMSAIVGGTIGLINGKLK